MTAQPEKVKPTTLTGGRQIGKSEVQGGPIGRAYDERNFYVAATDQNHQKTTVRLENGKTMAVPVWLAVQIRRWVDDPLTPYRYEYDMIRDALVHRQVYLNAHADSPPPNWDTFVEMAEIEREASEAQQQKQGVARIREILEQAMKDSDSELFQSTLKRAQKLLGQLRTPYKEELAKLLSLTPIKP